MQLSTIKQFTQKNPAFTEGGIRSEIFNESTNGLKESGAILRNGRKILIDEKRYFQWLAVKNGRSMDWFDELNRTCPDCDNMNASYPDCEQCGHRFDNVGGAQ